MDAHPLDAAQAILGRRFQDLDLLSVALTHSSAKSEESPANERLEFLGDSVLGVVIADSIFRRYPEADEGELTRIKSVVVSSSVLSQVGRKLGLESIITVGKGLLGDEPLPDSIIANVFEALVGALYLDGGLEAAREFVLAVLLPQIERVEKDLHRKNYKSLLQHLAQRELDLTPTYKVMREEGPDHLKVFEVVAQIGERDYGRGTGRSKKEAEQEAAGATLRLVEALLAEREPGLPASADPPGQAPEAEAEVGLNG